MQAHRRGDGVSLGGRAGRAPRAAHGEVPGPQGQVHPGTGGEAEVGEHEVGLAVDGHPDGDVHGAANWHACAEGGSQSRQRQRGGLGERAGEQVVHAAVVAYVHADVGRPPNAEIAHQQVHAGTRVGLSSDPGVRRLASGGREAQASAELRHAVPTHGHLIRHGEIHRGIGGFGRDIRRAGGAEISARLTDSLLDRACGVIHLARLDAGRIGLDGRVEPHDRRRLALSRGRGVEDRLHLRGQERPAVDVHLIDPSLEDRGSGVLAPPDPEVVLGWVVVPDASRSGVGLHRYPIGVGRDRCGSTQVQR